MNKLLKGSIAGVAGIVLLLGGAGTFASWNSSAAVAGGTIVAGQLNLTNSTTAGTWSVKRGSAAATPIADITTFKIVPGDVVSFSQDITLKADGNNLVATLAIAPGTVTGVVATGADAAAKNAANNALASFITKNATLVVTPAAGVTANGDGTYNVAASAGVSTTVKATVSLSFANGAAGAENTAMNGAVTLSGAGVSVTQN